MYLKNLLGVGAHHITQKEDIIGCITHLFGIQHNFLELSRFSKTLDHFVGHIGAQVDGERQGGVCSLHQISQFFGTF